MLHSRLQHAVAIGDGAEDRLAGHTRAVARQGLEDRCFEGDMPRLGQALKLKGANNALWRCDLVVHPVEPVFVALRIAMRVTPGAAAPRLKLLEFHLVATRANPA